MWRYEAPAREWPRPPLRRFRFLRASDRSSNRSRYPSLRYPEVYLLHAGYRAFYRQFPELCRPRGYTAMLDPRHRALLRDLRHAHWPLTSQQLNLTKIHGLSSRVALSVTCVLCDSCDGDACTSIERQISIRNLTFRKRCVLILFSSSGRNVSTLWLCSMSIMFI